MQSVLEFLAKLIASLGGWGYLVIFLAAALECSAFLGVFVPGDGVVLLAGFFAHREVLELKIVIPVVVAGGLIGDSVGYLLGRRLGDPWLRKHGGKFGLTHKRLDRTEKFFKKHAGKAVLFGRSISLAAAPVPFFAGASRMRYPAFLAYDAAGVLIRRSHALCQPGRGSGCRPIRSWPSGGLPRPPLLHQQSVFRCRASASASASAWESQIF